MKKLDYSAISFVGRRDNNQDACIVEELGNDIQFIAVADGMGGVTGGQIASNLVLKTSVEFLKNTFSNDPTKQDLKSILNNVFILSQEAIQKRISEEPVLSGMGTTLTAILISGEKYVWGNLGDSRIYNLKNDELNQITVDHTYVEDYKKEHEGEVPRYIIEQYSHYLTKSIDGGADTADIFPLEKDFEILNDNEMFLLCSDGLITNKVEDNSNLLLDYMVGFTELKKSVKNLICHAYYNDSSDNISVVIVENGKVERRKTAIKKYHYPPSDKKILKFIDSPRAITYAIGFIIIVILLLLLFL